MLDEQETRVFRARQRARARALGIVLGALAVLFFAITIVKIAEQSHRRSATVEAQ